MEIANTTVEKVVGENTKLSNQNTAYKEVNEKLLPILFSLLENDETIKNMETKANSFALLNADVMIAEQILKNSHY